MKLFLKEILNQRNMSVNELHKITGISRTTLDPLSKTDFLPSKTRFDTLMRIAEGLNITIDELIAFEKGGSNNIFNVETIDIVNNHFDGYIREYLDRIILKVSSDNSKYYLLMLTLKYSPDTYFDEKYKKQIETLENIVDKLRQTDKADKQKLDKEFDNIYDYMEKEGLSYSGKKTFSAQYSIFLRDISFYADNSKLLPKKYTDLYKRSTPFCEVIGSDIFIETVSDYISDMYDLKNNTIKKYFEIHERGEHELPFEVTDYIFINYESNKNNIIKNVIHKYYL